MSSPIQDFINGIIATTQATAKQNKWTPGGFAGNVAQGAGDLVGGAVNLVNPLSATNPINVAINHPEQTGPMATQFVKSLGGSINNTLGQPVNPQTKQFQMPSLAKAEQYGYEKPLDVAANLAMGAGAVSKVAKLGKIGEAGSSLEKASKAVKGTQPAGWTSEGMKVSGQLPAVPGMNLVSKTSKEIAGSAANKGASQIAKVSDTAANTYLKAFPVRREIGKNIDQVGVAKQMINDGITGDLPTINKNVHALLDKTESLKRGALGGLNGGVDVSNAAKTITNGLQGVPELAGKEAKAEVYRQQLQQYLPKNADINGMANPLDTYDSMRAIRNLGYDLVEQGKDVYGRTINAEKLNVGKVFINTAKDLNDSLDKTLKDQPLFTGMNNDPQALSDIQSISPRVAERVQGVQGWKDMQALQKPYVDMASMGKEAQDFTNTPGAHLTGQITDAVSKLGGMGVGGSIAGVPGLIGGTMLGQIASPFIQQAVEKFMPTIMTKGADAINKMQQGGLPGLPHASSASHAFGEAALYQPTQGQAGAKGQLAAATASNAARYQSPDVSGITTTQDYTSQQNALTQKIAQDKATGNYVQQQQDEGELSQLTNQWNNQKTIRDASVTFNNVTGLGNAAAALIQKADISLLNLNGSFDKLLNSTDPNNAALGKALQSIQNVTGINLSSAKTKDALLAGLDQAIGVAQNQYKAQQQQYSGGSAPTPPKQLPRLGAQQSAGLPPIGTPMHYNFDFGSNGEGMPAAP